MHSENPSSDATGALGVETGTVGNAARYVARERQKDELRDERDRLVLDLGRDLGPRGLHSGWASHRPRSTSCCRTRAAVLMSGWLHRLAAGSALGRLTTRGERWAEADAHYAELGSRGPPRTRPL